MFFFGAATVMESVAWARAGGGSSFGSRGSRSFSAPRMPSSPSPSSPGLNAPGRSPFQGPAGQPSGGFFSRSPFLQGMVGGLAGGMLGSLLFGGIGHASPGGMGGGGIGLLDIILIGALLYFGWRFFKRRRTQAVATGYYNAPGYSGQEGFSDPNSYYRPAVEPPPSASGELEAGLRQLRQFDPAFSEEAVKETFQDIFFRVQAAWMNRSLEGVEGIVSDEMAEIFRKEFDSMRRKGRINRLENIAIRKVEPTEVWQEMGKDYITVLITANLLDYTVDDTTGQVVGGDKFNPVKFQEFWTFCRDTGSAQWKLSAINQVEESLGAMN